MIHALTAAAAHPANTGMASFLAVSRRYLLGATLAVGLGIVPALAEPANHTEASDSHLAVEKTGQIMSDSWITTQIKSQILADPASKDFHVGVHTHYGAVVLEGNLASQDAIDHVKYLAERVEGVKSVSTVGLKVSTK